MTAGAQPCRICGSDEVALVKPANISSQVQSKDFQITDHHYGVTLAIYRCDKCGFMQCTEVADTVNFYQALEDPEYEAGRSLRLLQAKAILKTVIQTISVLHSGSRLLDIGAGSGILVEAATNMGFDAEGIEPSNWLQALAVKNGCRVHSGVLPHPAVNGPFDAVTIIDVIEHVDDPRALLKSAASLVSQSGVVVIVTPDAGSILARLMGWRWWHYRIAHVGYFTRHNLELACQRGGLRVVATSRPGWVFSMDYLLTRLRNYLPAWLLPRARTWMQRVSIPLNLGDSLMVIARPDKESNY